MREGLDVAICDEGIASAISEEQSATDGPSQLAEIGRQLDRHGINYRGLQPELQ